MIRFWEDQPELSGRLEKVREIILQRAGSDDPDVRGAVSQLLAASGKMLRPAFVLLASQFGAPDPEGILRTAAAVEMLHMATLVHDDIIDGAPLRRGAATLHALRGPRVAVLAGDWLFASCFSLVADLGGEKHGGELARLVTRICGSEISQSSQRFAVSTSIRRYLRRIAGKTAALFALAFHVGAVQASCPETQVSVLRRLGYCLGMGFQIVDDILDFSPDGAETGKRPGGDLSQGIYTLPVVHSLRADDGTLAGTLARSRRSRRAGARAARLVTAGQGILLSRAAAETYTRRAILAIDQLPPANARETLRIVTGRLLHRTW
jgi:heptaprenyl diphosphate synthase